VSKNTKFFKKKDETAWEETALGGVGGGGKGGLFQGCGLNREAKGLRGEEES